MMKTRVYTLEQRDYLFKWLKEYLITPEMRGLHFYIPDIEPHKWVYIQASCILEDSFSLDNIDPPIKVSAEEEAEIIASRPII